tara:strand:- start:74 stop:256 length:183 start_codon:yes stop_codon:yes gene_type:complete
VQKIAKSVVDAKIVELALANNKPKRILISYKNKRYREQKKERINSSPKRLLVDRYKLNKT